MQSTALLVPLFDVVRGSEKRLNGSDWGRDTSKTINYNTYDSVKVDIIAIMMMIITIVMMMHRHHDLQVLGATDYRPSAQPRAAYLGHVPRNKFPSNPHQ